MKTIDKIKEVVSNKYMLSVKSEAEVFKTSYKEGDIDFINFYNNETFIDSNLCNDDTLIESIKNLVMFYIQNIIYVDITENEIIDSLINCENALIINDLVDSENLKASEHEIERWKNGEIELYSQYNSICVYVNGIELSTYLLLEIFTTDN